MLIEALSGNDESGSCGGVNSVQGQPVLHPVAIPGRRWLRGWSNFFNLFMLRYVSFFFFRLNDFFDFCAPGNSGCVAVTTVEVGVAGVSLTGFHSAATQQYTGPSR